MRCPDFQSYCNVTSAGLVSHGTGIYHHHKTATGVSTRLAPTASNGTCATSPQLLLHFKSLATTHVRTLIVVFSRVYLYQPRASQNPPPFATNMSNIHPGARLCTQFRRTLQCRYEIPLAKHAGNVFAEIPWAHSYSTQKCLPVRRLQHRPLCAFFIPIHVAKLLCRVAVNT